MCRRCLLRCLAGVSADTKDNTNQTVRKAFAPSIGTDGSAEIVVYNSEAHAGDPARGEELMSLDLSTGAVTELTHAPGHQYGSVLRPPAAFRIAVQSNADLTSGAPTAEAHTDLYIADAGGLFTKVDIADPTNAYNDGAPDWIQ